MSTPTGPEASALLDGVRAESKAAIEAEVRRLQLVLDWCVLHETDDEEQASFGDHGIPLAGDGAPWVSEFAVMELGTALGGSTDSARRYVGAALEVRYRLPRVWERVAADPSNATSSRPATTSTAAVVLDSAACLTCMF